MDAKAIREVSADLLKGLRENMSKQDSLEVNQAKMNALMVTAVTEFLGEIAAQLAELNEQIKPGKLTVNMEGR